MVFKVIGEGILNCKYFILRGRGTIHGDSTEIKIGTVGLKLKDLNQVRYERHFSCDPSPKFNRRGRDSNVAWWITFSVYFWIFLSWFSSALRDIDFSCTSYRLLFKKESGPNTRHTSSLEFVAREYSKQMSRAMSPVLSPKMKMMGDWYKSRDNLIIW
jgi:hypothetical protein